MQNISTRLGEIDAAAQVTAGQPHNSEICINLNVNNGKKKPVRKPDCGSLCLHNMFEKVTATCGLKPVVPAANDQSEISPAKVSLLPS